MSTLKTAKSHDLFSIWRDVYGDRAERKVALRLLIQGEPLNSEESSYMMRIAEALPVMRAELVEAICDAKEIQKNANSDELIRKLVTLVEPEQGEELFRQHQPLDMLTKLNVIFFGHLPGRNETQRMPDWLRELLFMQIVGAVRNETKRMTDYFAEHPEKTALATMGSYKFVAAELCIYLIQEMSAAQLNSDGYVDRSVELLEEVLPDNITYSLGNPGCFVGIARLLKKPKSTYEILRRHLMILKRRPGYDLPGYSWEMVFCLAEGVTRMVAPDDKWFLDKIAELWKE